jgi:hypothetical protein
MTRSGARLLRTICLATVALAAATPARAAIFGDVTVTVVSEPKGGSTHGYLEYLIDVRNGSESQTRRVTLTLPADGYRYRFDSIRSLSRTVQVGPKETVRMSLLQPDHPPISGKGLAVSIDGRREDDIVPLRPNETSRSGYGYYYGFSYGPRGYGSSASLPLVLCSPSIRKPFPETTPPPGMGRMPGGMMPPLPGPAGGPPTMKSGPPGAPPARPGAPPPAPRRAMSPLSVQFVKADTPVEAWSPHWLGYTRYDGIVVTGDDLRTAPAPVQTALWQYVETGGSLLVLGSASNLPEGWKRRQHEKAGFTVHEAGFGECLVSSDDNIDQWKRERWNPLEASWKATATPWEGGQRRSDDANRLFPVVDDIGVPVKGLFVLMLLFTLAIGPLNFVVLSRKKRRIWLLWTAPAISLVTCLAVFGYMLVSEGWRGHLRTEALTVLDQSTRRATTVGWTAFYSPLTPGDGLRFSYDTEVVSQRLNDGPRAGSRACTLDWTDDQHLARGWVEARVPAHFKVRKSEARRERVTVSRGEDGTPTMVNGLGAPIRRICYADEKGVLYTAEQVAPGARVALVPRGESLPDAAAPEKSLRAVFGENWLQSLQSLPGKPAQVLTPRSYLAELDDAPFVEDALRNVRTRKCRSLVLGLMKDTDEGD